MEPKVKTQQYEAQQCETIAAESLMTASITKLKDCVEITTSEFLELRMRLSSVISNGDSDGIRPMCGEAPALQSPLLMAIDEIIGSIDTLTNKIEDTTSSLVI